VQLSAEQKEMYTKLKATLKLEYDNNKLSVSSSINLMQRLAEITGGFYSYIDEEAMAKDVVGINDQVKIKYKKEYLKSNPKAKELMAFIDSLPDDEPVIIWAVSKMEVAYLVNLFKDKFGAGSVAEMHGDVSREDRTIGLNDFQEYKRRFIIGNQAVGGIGLNMTAASIMVYFSNDFSLRRRIQSEGRIERIGQTRPMLYVDFVCAGTIDKYIVKSLREKSDFSEEVRRAFDSGSIYDLV
jgi:SNF2 family DNA or RNA helicase